MKPLFLSLLLTVSTLSMSLICFAAGKDSVEVEVTFLSKEVRALHGTDIMVTIRSHTKSAILLPEHITWGWAFDSLGGILGIEIQRKEDDHYTDSIGNMGFIDNVPPYGIDTVLTGQVRSFFFPLRHLCPYTVGTYRVRVLCRFSQVDGNLKDEYSNWVYFSCKKEREIE